MFSYLEGTPITFAVAVAIFYPPGVFSGFRRQFWHRGWTQQYIEGRN
ncbi:hypothetical protein GCM10007108_07340 [Thermogymnomonas acidicola]|uniref:Uncharacterized protein n=1 Tax=Thermogymnomonas acidicola TaxID=399579 RepID=A0AA37F983_9ARCH|nr:hypothetical protein [Thermogymnomonas acidicola]GGM71765.1 hypothetical protein GCM10007108_07340 [Thermogymnomonas acidicola]